VPGVGTNDREGWLGYIRFNGRDGEGTVEIVNRSATIQPWHLDLGGTSKADNDHQAGAHGEGLKIALLVLMRGHQNHSVRCRSGGFNWTFNFTDRGRLVARLHRMSAGSIRKVEDQSRRQIDTTLLPFAAKPKSDVQFVIGEGLKGRDEWGRPVKRSPVKRENFDAWTTAALFLHEPQDGVIISTEDGDLLTTSQLCGNIYLKGLLLNESTPSRSASITNRPLKFGYNFAFGRTNRGRQSVAGANEESKAILAIWSSVLVAVPEMVQELSDMLDTTEPEYADVSGAKKHINLETASILREYLFGEEFAGKWYYSGVEKSKVWEHSRLESPILSLTIVFWALQNQRLRHIIQGLGCEGMELTTMYWNILRRHDLIHTAEEEERLRFTAAPPAVVPETSFATIVCRLLRACVRSFHKTNNMEIRFVQAGQLHLQLFYSEAERLFLIHERWLSIEGAIEELGLSDDLVEADVVFHTVKGLFADALEQLPREVFLEDANTRTAEWRRKLEMSRAEQRILNYLRMVNVNIDIVKGRPELRLRWAVDYHWSVDTSLEIQCHRASRCSHLRDNLLIAEDGRHP
jgi:hypothetical protein